MAAYCQVYGVNHFTSPAGWLPVHRDQLWAQRSVTSMGKTLTLIFIIVSTSSHSNERLWEHYKNIVFTMQASDQASTALLLLLFLLRLFNGHSFEENLLVWFWDGWSGLVLWFLFNVLIFIVNWREGHLSGKTPFHPSPAPPSSTVPEAPD